LEHATIGRRRMPGERGVSLAPSPRSVSLGGGGRVDCSSAPCQ
jgi:hypothetical protein